MNRSDVSRRGFLQTCALGASAAALPVQAFGKSKSHKRPNVLFLLADDQRPDSIGAFGNPYIQTPNIDCLIENGFSFRRNYCFGSNSGAVCIPSRAMINCGKSYFRVKHDLSDTRIMPEIFQENGYTTFGTGKWHNQQKSYLRGFQKGKNIMFGGMSDHPRVPVVDLSPDGKVVNKRTGDGYSSEIFANSAIEFIENHKEDKPFYAYVAFTAPHDPRNPPTEYREMYYKKRPPLPFNFKPQHPFDNGQMVLRDENLGAWPRTEEMIRDQLAEYYGLITHLDVQIGRILETLKRTGHADNTIIVYAADHGLAVGSHGLLGKQNVYEHSMGCPLVFSGPGIPKGGSTQAFSYLFDIFPTLCSITGVDTPDDVDGKCLRPIWEGKQTKVRDTVFTSYCKIQRAVRDDQWKLIRYPKINHTQLFNMKDDPNELYNLANEPGQAGRVKKMMKLLKKWQKESGDDLPLSVDNPKKKEIDLTGHERKPDKWQPDWIIKKYF
jgi:arylsulfatase A-like enzyme